MESRAYGQGKGIAKSREGQAQENYVPWDYNSAFILFLLSGFEPETYWDRMHLFQEAIAHRFVP